MYSYIQQLKHFILFIVILFDYKYLKIKFKTIKNIFLRKKLVASYKICYIRVSFLCIFIFSFTCVYHINFLYYFSTFLVWLFLYIFIKQVIRILFTVLYNLLKIKIFIPVKGRQKKIVFDYVCIQFTWFNKSIRFLLKMERQFLILTE